jgi:hypothetical protein
MGTLLGIIIKNILLEKFRILYTLSVYAQGYNTNVLWRVLTRLMCGSKGKNVVINEIVGFGGFFFFLVILGKLTIHV